MMGAIVCEYNGIEVFLPLVLLVHSKYSQQIKKNQMKPFTSSILGRLVWSVSGILYAK